jgi:hypothetical protein
MEIGLPFKKPFLAANAPLVGMVHETEGYNSCRAGDNGLERSGPHSEGLDRNNAYCRKATRPTCSPDDAGRGRGSRPGVMPTAKDSRYLVDVPKASRRPRRHKISQALSTFSSRGKLGDLLKA